MIRARIPLISVFSVAVLLLTACGDDTTDAPPPATSTTAPAPADPYEVYLKIAPDGAPELSREDAQTRAILGCGRKWAPGTVDAALAEAYADLCTDQ